MMCDSIQCYLWTTKKTNYMIPSYGWGSTVSRLRNHDEETVYFKFPGLPGNHLIDLGRVKG